MGVRRVPCRRRRWTPSLIALTLALVPPMAPSSRAQETSGLYQFTVIVTGYDMRRPRLRLVGQVGPGY
jgi:hypothetical protein